MKTIIFMYADDMLILSQHPNVNTMLDNLQSRVKITSNWCCVNQLTVNKSKTKLIMVIKQGNNVCDQGIFIGETKLKQVYQH